MATDSGFGTLRLWEFRDIGPVILCAALIFTYVGYGFGMGTHTDYLPWIRHLADPSILARDWTIASPPYHYNMMALMARLSKIMSLPLAFLITHIITTVLFVWAILLLSRSLFQSRLVFYLTLFLLLHWGLDISGAEAIGGNALYSFQFAPHVVAVPFCLLAFHCFIRERYEWAGLFAGLATIIHFLLGGITMLILGAYLIWRMPALGWRRPVMSFLGYGLVAGFTVIPAIWTQFTMKTAATMPHPFTTILGHFRAPHHHLPSAFPGASYARFLTFLLFALAAFQYKPEPGMHRRTGFICGAIGVLCLIGTIFVEIIPIDLITKLQFFRMVIFVKLFVILYIANFLKRVLDEGDRVKSWLVLALIMADQYLLIAGLAGWLLGYQYRKHKLYQYVLWGASGLLLSLIVIGTASQASGRVGQIFNLGIDRMAIFAIGFLLLAILYEAYRAAQAPAPRPIGPVLVLLLTAVLIRDIADAWYHNGVKSYFRYDMQATLPWERMSVWVRDHTPKDALFIAPPYLGGFRVYSERAVIANFATSPLWDKDLPEWKRRLEDLCGGAPLDCRGFESCGEAMARGYAALTEPAIRALAEKYGAEYFVTETRDDLPFEMIYSSEEYVVYKLK